MIQIKPNYLVDIASQKVSGAEECSKYGNFGINSPGRFCQGDVLTVAALPDFMIHNMNLQIFILFLCYLYRYDYSSTSFCNLSKKDLGGTVLSSLYDLNESSKLYLIMIYYIIYVFDGYLNVWILFFLRICLQSVHSHFLLWFSQYLLFPTFPEFLLHFLHFS